MTLEDFGRRGQAAQAAVDTILAEAQQRTYELLTTKFGPAIMCWRCGLTSYNRNDVVQRYCGHCHHFHEDPRS